MLVRENEARLRRICRVYAHDAEGRKDLQQEILLQLWRSLPSFAGASSPHTWLYRVALNTALTYARHHAAAIEIPLEEDSLASEEHAEALGAGSGGMEAMDASDRLYAAIGRLPSVDRMLITMFLDEQSYREMAQVIGISESNVGVKLHRIRKALSRLLTTEAV